ncbi:GntR family transcriptional regulator [bacterium AH-315-I18]|nr:GntR family transcriptional regulator [Phycisphaeraceae bacterium]MBN4061137.1 GntR family transcriptional regulator [bacterium AH-315-I18]
MAHNLLSIQSASDEPLIEQIRNDLRTKVRTGVLAPGYRLPSMRKLSNELGVSLGIVQQAINTLTAEGILDSQPRRGVFVIDPQLRKRDVALILPSLQLPSMSAAIRGIRAGLRSTTDTPYRLMIHAADTDFDQQMDMLLQLDTSSIAGAIILPPGSSQYVKFLEAFANQNIPCIQASIALEGLDMCAVVTDGLETGRMLFEHLLEAGHRHIGIVGNDSDTQTMHDIHSGAQMVLDEYGLDLAKLPRVDARVDHLNPDEPWLNGQIAATQLLNANPQLTACVGTDNSLTLGIYKAAKALGLKLPDELSIIGMGPDQLAFSLTEPTLTVVDMGLENICRHAAIRLRQLINPKSKIPHGVSHIMPTLHDRQSVKKI